MNSEFTVNARHSIYTSEGILKDSDDNAVRINVYNHEYYEILDDFKIAVSEINCKNGKVGLERMVIALEVHSPAPFKALFEFNFISDFMQIF